MNRRFIISGGGTGGHIFPALAIAGELKKRDPGASILFVGALGRMEMERVPAAGYPIIGLPVEGFKRKITLKNIAVLYKAVVSVFKASGIIKSFRPDAVIGVGGYASGPMLRAAARKGIPTVIQEQNSYAGVTNRLLAKKAKKICVAYAGMEKYFPAEKIILTGNPIREEIVSGKADRKTSCESFGISDSVPVVLILGGSLGARTINESILAGTDALERENVQVLWQTGKLYIEGIRSALRNRELQNIHYFDFISRMDYAYTAADIIISRAGAATISELCLLGKPAILVPSPNVAEDHQTKNAMALVGNNAALMVKDKESKEKLVPAILDLLHNPGLQQQLGENCKKMGLSGSSARIVDEIFKQIEKQ